MGIGAETVHYRMPQPGAVGSSSLLTGAPGCGRDAGTLKEGSALMQAFKFPPVTISRSVTVQDAADQPDPRVDLRFASLAVSRDLRLWTVTAKLQQPTNPTSPNWWRGLSVPRPGIAWGLNLDGSGNWQYVVNLRGDPDLGAYGYVERGQETPSQITCQASASFDGMEYRVQFPSTCLGGIPQRIRFTAYVQLYDDTGTGGILGGDYAPDWAEYSDWLNIPNVSRD
jgi:hypothetical protein